MAFFLISDLYEVCYCFSPLILFWIWNILNLSVGAPYGEWKHAFSPFYRIILNGSTENHCKGVFLLWICVTCAVICRAFMVKSPRALRWCNPVGTSVVRVAWSRNPQGLKTHPVHTTFSENMEFGETIFQNTHINLQTIPKFDDNLWHGLSTCPYANNNFALFFLFCLLAIFSLFFVKETRFKNSNSLCRYLLIISYGGSIGRQGRKPMAKKFVKIKRRQSENSYASSSIVLLREKNPINRSTYIPGFIIHS